jgi:hypothetical protein
MQGRFQASQDRKQFGAALDLIDHDQPAQVTQGRHGFVEPHSGVRVLQIEVIERILGR